MRLHTDRKFIRFSLLAFALILLAGGGAAYFVKTFSKPVRQEAETPAETPVPTPIPTPEPARSAEPEVSPSAEIVPVKAALNGEALFYAADEDSVVRAMERAVLHFAESALAAQEGATLISSAWEETPELLPVAAEETDAFLDEDGVYALLTSADSPLDAKITVRFSYTETVAAKTEQSRTENLPKGMRAILNMGRNGVEEVVMETVYTNGEPGEAAEAERIALREAYPLKIVNGRLSVPGKNAQPGRSEGTDGPDEGNLDFDSPISKGKVVSNFGGREGAWHHGLDYSFASGAEAVAAESGTVVAAMDWGGYGLTVELDHGNGFTTRYAHLDSVYVSVGDTVEKGQPLGLAGGTGDAEEPHLHFELRVNGMAYNPRYYID